MKRRYLVWIALAGVIVLGTYLWAPAQQVEYTIQGKDGVLRRVDKDAYHKNLERIRAEVQGGLKDGSIQPAMTVGNPALVPTTGLRQRGGQQRQGGFLQGRQQQGNQFQGGGCQGGQCFPSGSMTMPGRQMMIPGRSRGGEYNTPGRQMGGNRRLPPAGNLRNVYVDDAPDLVRSRPIQRQGPSTPDRAVCLVRCELGRGERGVGSGTVIWASKQADTAYVLTCAHIFRGAVGPPVVVVDGREYPATVVGQDSEDVTLLAIRFPPNAVVHPIAEEDAEIGDELWVGGYAKASKFMGINTPLLAWRSSSQDGPKNWMEMQGSTPEGVSGGPVLNQRGYLVGVQWGSVGRVVLATRITYIRERFPILRRLLRLPPKVVIRKKEVIVGTPPKVPIPDPGQFLPQMPSIICPCPGGICPSLPAETPPLEKPKPMPDGLAEELRRMGLDVNLLQIKVDGVEERQDQFDKDLAATKQKLLDAIAEIPSGASGEDGKDGVDGKDGAVGPQGLAGEDAVITDELIDQIVDRVKADLPSDQPLPEGDIDHLVIVVDETADYWPRMQMELERARGYFSAIELVEPPDYSVPLPQLVGFKDGTPIYRAKGVRAVSEALTAIIRGEFPFLFPKE